MPDYNLKITVGLDGVPQVTGGLHQIDGGIDNTAAKTTAATGRMASGMGEVEAATGRMAAGHDRVIAALAGYASSVIGIYAVGHAIETVTGKSLGYLGLIETSALGIASSYMTGGKYIDETTGKVLQGQQALTAAQGDSAEAVSRLQYANLQTIATLDQIIRAYQETLPVAQARGFSRTQVEQFTTAVVQAAGAIDASGQLMHMLGEETRSLLTGAIEPRNSRIAMALGLRPEDVKAHMANADELYTFLMGKLEAYKVAGVESQKTWAGLWSNVKDIAMQGGGQAFQPLFDTIKAELTEITNRIVTIDEKSRTIKWNPEFLTFIDEVKQGIGSVIAEIYRMNMLLDKAGGTKTSLDMLGSGPGSALGISREKHPFLAMLLGSKEEFAEAAKSNIEYADRYLANDRKLQELAYRMAGLDANGNPLKKPSGNNRYQANPLNPEDDKGISDYNKFVTAFNAQISAIDEANPHLSAHEKEVLRVRNTYEKFMQDIPGHDAEWRQLERYVLQQIGLNKEWTESMDEASGLYHIALMDQARAAQEASDIYQLTLQDQAAVEQQKQIRLGAIANELAKVATAEQYYQLSATDAAEQKLALYREQLALQEQQLAAVVGNGTQEQQLRIQILGTITQTNAALLEQQKIIADRTALGGAIGALHDYSDAAFNTGAQVRGAFTDAFQGAEDALVKFVRTGKLELHSLVDSIINDLARMAIKQNITGPLSNSLMQMLPALFSSASPASSGGFMQAAPAFLSMGADALKPAVTSLGPTIANATKLGALAGTQAGASAGIMSTMGAYLPIIGAVAVGGMMLNSYLKSGGMWNQHTDPQKAMIGAATYMTGGIAMLVDQWTGGKLFGTKWSNSASGAYLGVNNGDVWGTGWIQQSREKEFWGGTETRNFYPDLDAQWAQFIDSQYDSIINAIHRGGSTMGMQVAQAALDSLTIKPEHLNLGGKSAEDQQKVVSDYFREVNNKALVAAFPELGTYQDIGGKLQFVGSSLVRLGEDATAAFERMENLRLANNKLLMQELDLQGLKGSTEYMRLLNIQREDELARLDPSTAAIQRRINALQDEQAIAEKAQKAAEFANDLEARRLSLGGNVASLALYRLRIEQEQQLRDAQENGMDVTALQIVQAQEWAAAVKSVTGEVKQSITSLVDSTRSAVMGTVDAQLVIANALKGYLTGPESHLSPQAAYQQAQVQFAALAGKTDLDSLKKLPDAFDLFMKTSEAFNATGAAFQRDQEWALSVMSAASGAAGTTLPQVDSQISLLEKIRSAVADDNGGMARNLAAMLGPNSTLAGLIGEWNQSTADKLTADKRAAADQTFQRDKGLYEAAQKTFRAGGGTVEDYQKALDAMKASYSASAAAGNSYGNMMFGDIASTGWVPGAIGTGETDARMSIKAASIATEALNMAVGKASPNLLYDLNRDGRISIDDALMWSRISTGATLWSSLGLPAFADGGVTNRPSIFGEAGWEAAVPLPDGRSIPVTINRPVAADNREVVDELKKVVASQDKIITRMEAQIRQNGAAGQATVEELRGVKRELAEIRRKANLEAAA